MLLGAMAQPCGCNSILDVGTGNGMLALMMAQKNPSSRITAIEIDEKCARQAALNFKQSPFGLNIDLLNADFIDYEFRGEYDMIISNPPYFSNAFLPADMKRAKARHEATMTLSNFLEKAHLCLKDHGSVWFVLPVERTDEAISHGCRLGFVLERRIKIAGKPGGHVRDILQMIKTSEPVLTIEDSFTVRNEDGLYTEEYKSLTRDFHFTDL